MTQKNTDPAIVKLPNVRLSFPHLFQAHAMEGSEPKFSCTLLLDNTKHAQLLDHIDALIDRLALDEFKKKVPLKHKCLHDGNEKMDIEGYGDGVSYIVASKKTRPAVVDRDLTPLTEADGKIYAGCYVDATIRLWVQNNKWGKGVNAELRAIRFNRDGESLGGAAPVNVENEFDDMPAGEEAPKSNRSSAKRVSAKRVTADDL